MENYNLDTKKLPLGKLSQETIKKGLEYLQQIMKVLKKEEKGDVVELSGKFYTYIPHAASRAAPPPPIRGLSSLSYLF